MFSRFAPRSVVFGALVMAAVGSASLSASRSASGDVTHVVGRGHTLEAIAHRYHVSVKAIMDANHLKGGARLQPGEKLIIPGVTDKKKPDAKKPTKGDAPPPPAAHKAETPNAVIPGPHARGPSFAEKPSDSDVVRAVRFGEESRVRVKGKSGRIPGPAIKSFERLLRSGNATHKIDPRLIALVGLVSNHFGGRPLEIISGYRPYVSTQYTQHSNHNLGRAMDFRVRGVPSEVVRDFCKGLRNVGVGYYPASDFVHLDVRDAPAYWIDYSKPGEPPKYDRPNTGADEGVSDVPNDRAPDPAPSRIE
jgi:uncharacterized protein YcbK (DUF882 family)/LysM repeat protein